MNIFQRIGQAVKGFIGKRITGTTTKNRIVDILKNYTRSQRARRESLLNIKDDNSIDYRNKLASNVSRFLENTSNFLNKNKVKHLRTLTEKELKLFESIYSLNIKDSVGVNGLKVFDELSSFKQMLLTTLQERGVDVYDPRALYQALEGHTPEEIYEAWKSNEYENEDFYEEWVEDPEDVLDKLFQVGIDKSVKGYNRRQSTMWDDMKEFF